MSDERAELLKKKITKVWWFGPPPIGMTAEQLRNTIRRLVGLADEAGRD